MKYFYGLLMLLCITLSIHAQTAQEEIFENINLAGGNYYAYPTPSGKHTAPPKGYAPFYLSHYARHGSRFLINEEKAYNEPVRVLKAADKADVLTGAGKQILIITDSMANMARKRYGELTPVGVRQHQGIAERMYQDYPQIFRKKAHIDARSTIIIRCILSMTSQCLQLKELNPQLTFSYDASEHDMYYMNYSDDFFSAERKKNDKATKDLQRKFVHPERLMKVMFKDMNYVEEHIDSENLMIALFEMARNMQSHDTGLDLFSFFTKQECYDLWKRDNIRWYIRSAATPLSDGQLPFVEANLLENILNTADTCLTKKESSATLRFGHESCLLPLACLMELGNCGYQTDDLENLHEVWRAYKFFPMASNIQLVFYRHKKNPDILVKILLNEEEQMIPVESDMAPYYRWKDVEQYYRTKLDAGLKHLPAVEKMVADII
ncbi:histidine-type phosphatase [Proteiniphilum sp. UBA5384]|uniref:histidine-type phosphatase n=1 Tax=Proteiniphilum sp. UBA5384 TaxID=1947279 RepID=UPI0025D61BF8|nr:histidine-type phosphatase [Proteiniphilum sp. UBA5384]